MANLEITPDAKLIIGVDLADRHPLMVGLDGRELAVGEACAGGRESAACGRVVRVGGTGFPCVVGNLL